MNDGYTILIAEDDEDIVSLLSLYLKSSGYRVIAAGNGADALKIVRREKVDLALLDVMMPEMDGYELTRRIRTVSNIPILILSARGQDYDRILGLNLGADDYLTKPFNPMEVVARIQANLRRFYELGAGKGVHAGDGKLQVGQLCLNPAEMSVSRAGQPVALTPTEYRILHKLMKAPGRVYTRAQLYESINGEFTPSDEQTMMVHISKLREKIEEDPKNPRYIITVRGLGYKLEDGE